MRHCCHGRAGWADTGLLPGDVQNRGRRPCPLLARQLDIPVLSTGDFHQRIEMTHQLVTIGYVGRVIGAVGVMDSGVLFIDPFEVESTNWR